MGDDFKDFTLRTLLVYKKTVQSTGGVYTCHRGVCAHPLGKACAAHFKRLCTNPLEEEDGIS